MADTNEPPLPPAEPRRSQNSSGGYDQSARLQMVAALFLGMVLVAVPLYLWRRPHNDAVVVAEQADAAANALAEADASIDAAPSASDGGALSAVTLTPASILACHDPGPQKTSPDKCDHLVAFEQSFARAIEGAAGCVPVSAGGGTLPFVADVSFQRKRTPILVSIAKEGRTLKGARVGSACIGAVKKALSSFSLESLTHAHSRYKIVISASYPEPSRMGTVVTPAFAPPK